MEATILLARYQYEIRSPYRPKELDVEQKVVKLFDDQKIMTNVRSSGVPISDSNLEVPEFLRAPLRRLSRYREVYCPTICLNRRRLYLYECCG